MMISSTPPCSTWYPRITYPSTKRFFWNGKIILNILQEQPQPPDSIKRKRTLPSKQRKTTMLQIISTNCIVKFDCSIRKPKGGMCHNKIVPKIVSMILISINREKGPQELWKKGPPRKQKKTTMLQRMSANYIIGLLFRNHQQSC